MGTSRRKFKSSVKGLFAEQVSTDPQFKSWQGSDCGLWTSQLCQGFQLPPRVTHRKIPENYFVGLSGSCTNSACYGAVWGKINDLESQFGEVFPPPRSCWKKSVNSCQGLPLTEDHIRKVRREKVQINTQVLMTRTRHLSWLRSRCAPVFLSKNRQIILVAACSVGCKR